MSWFHLVCKRSFSSSFQSRKLTRLKLFSDYRSPGSLMRFLSLGLFLFCHYHWLSPPWWSPFVWLSLGQDGEDLQVQEFFFKHIECPFLSSLVCFSLNQSKILVVLIPPLVALFLSLCLRSCRRAKCCRTWGLHSLWVSNRINTLSL